jgi:asparagine synthase (glutamine-hydrolysing)
MSEFAGILNFDSEAAVDAADINLLSSALGGDPSETVNSVIKGPFGLCFRATHIDKISRSTKQPFVDRHGNVFAFDGMLHNRDELQPMLSSFPLGNRRRAADIEFLGSSYLKWKKECIARLIGDFALVIWDKQDQTLFMARDHAGTRTLYYHCGKDRIIWSSQLEPLLSLAGGTPEIDDEYIAWYLIYSPPAHLTPFQKFFAVQPGHVISVQREKVVETRYWGLDTAKEIRYKSDSEYEEHYFHEFKNAVRCRTRSDGPVFAELSGGLDSSAVVCMASHLIKSGEALASELQPVSAVCDLSPKSDELKFISSVEEYIGQTGIHIKESESPLFIHLSVENANKVLTPLLFCAEYHYSLGRMVRERNGTVVLSGQGGDEINYSSSDPTPELCDLLVKLKLLRLHHRIKAWGANQKRSYLKVLWRNVIAPMLPPIRHGRGSMVPKIKIPKLLQISFVKQANLSIDKLLSDPFGFSLPSGRDRAIGYWSVVLSLASGDRRHISDSHISYPYLHRPFVEFMQAIPIEQKIRPGHSRSLHRRALASIMPDKIMKRKGKGDPTEAICRAIRGEWPRLQSLFNDARVYQYGYVDRTEMETALEMARNGVKDSLLDIIRIAPLEVWLRSLEGRGSDLAVHTSIVPISAPYDSWRVGSVRSQI